MQTYEELLEMIAKQQELIKKLTAELAKANQRIAELEKANQRISELENEVARLKEQRNKNSHNSSKPPSSDGYEKPSPKSQRKSSGRKAGGQKGHKGHHIALGKPDRVETIYPTKCANCPHRNNCEKLRVSDTCYVVDIIVKKETVKYQMMECNCGGICETAQRPAGIKGAVTYGNNLKALICVLNTKGMVAAKNLCEIVEGLTGIKPSEGTVVNMLKSAAEAVKSVVSNFPRELQKSHVVHSDETGARVNGKLNWVHVICTKKITYYALSEKRGAEAMQEIGFLPNYHGIVVHDFWKSYFKFTDAQHAMCGAHLLRELTGVFENHPEQTWAKDMYYQLLNMNRVADFYNRNTDVGSREHYMSCLKRSYDDILEKALKQNPLSENNEGKRGKPKKGTIRALIDRLRDFKNEVCRFADNALVPFTNNQAERDLRMVKMKNKVIGCFRSKEGAKDFLMIKSFTSTAAKNGFTAFHALFLLLSGKFCMEIK